MNRLLTSLNGIVAGFFLVQGIRLYMAGPVTLADIALPLYAATGFGGAAQGLRVNNVWLVTMSTLALLGCSGLYLLIFLVGDLPRGVDITSNRTQQLLVALALSTLVVINQGVAMWRSHRKAPRQ